MSAATRSLIWREWRELRPVTLGLGVVALVVTLLMQHFVYKYNEPLWAVKDLVPVLTGLYVAIAASDLVAGDVRSGRMDELARLPVPIAQVGRAKLLFLLLAGTGFAAACWLAQIVVPLLAGRGEVALASVSCGTAAMPKLAFVAILGLCVASFSSLGIRSFASALLGVGLVFAGLWCIDVLGFEEHLFRLHRYARGEVHPIVSAQGALVAVGSSLTLLVGLRGVFVRGPIHGAGRVRLAVLAFAPFLIVAIPVGGYAAHRVREATAIEPYSGDIDIAGIDVSPDGKYVVFGAGNAHSSRRRLPWVIRIADGELFTWASERDHRPRWTRDGRLSIYRIPMNGELELRLWVSPETGELLHRPNARERNEQEINPFYADFSRWGFVSSNSPTHEMKPFGVSIAATGDHFVVKSFGRPQPLAEPGVVLTVDYNRRLARVDARTGEETRLDPRRVDRMQPFMVSPSGRYVLARFNGETCVLEAATGKVIRRQEPGGHPRWARGAGERDLLLLDPVAPSQPHGVGGVFDPTSGNVRRIEHLLDPEAKFACLSDVQTLTDGRLVAVRYQTPQSEMLLLGPDFQVERVLYGPKNGEER